MRKYQRERKFRVRDSQSSYFYWTLRNISPTLKTDKEISSWQKQLRKSTVRTNENLEVEREAFRQRGNELKHRDKEKVSFTLSRPHRDFLPRSLNPVLRKKWSLLSHLPNPRLKCDSTLAGVAGGVLVWELYYTSDRILLVAESMSFFFCLSVFFL